MENHLLGYRFYSFQFLLHIGKVMWVTVVRLIILLISKNSMDLSVSYTINLKKHCKAFFATEYGKGKECITR